MAYGRLPLYFEANQGQTDQRVKFISRGRGYTLFLSSTEAALLLQKPKTKLSAISVKLSGAPQDRRSKPEAQDNEQTVIRMKFPGANPEPKVVGLEELPGKSNYFIGNDPKNWRTNVTHYAKVKYEEIYPGIDLVFYGNQKQLEFDFVIAPGADPNIIKLVFDGTEKIELDEEGQLVMWSSSEQALLRKPLVYQEVDGRRHEIAAAYVVASRHKSDNPAAAEVGIQLADYETSKRLIIDPVLVYSTYLGGTGDDQAQGIAIDPSGNIYITGFTSSLDFPTENQLQMINASGVFKTVDGGANWDFASTGLVNNNISALALEPGNPATIYAGTAGGGVFKSTDAGTTWTSVNADLTNLNVSALSIDHVTPSTVYAGTSGGGPCTTTGECSGGSVFKSTDGGTTWSLAHFTESGNGFRALAIDPTTPTIIYGWILKSEDGGETWATLDMGNISTNILAIAIDPSNPEILYAATDVSGIRKSTDGGETWVGVNAGLTPLGESVTALAIDPPTTSTVYAGIAGRGIFKTTDAGQNWSPVNTGLSNLNVSSIVIDPMNPEKLYAGTDGGGVFKSINGGGSWSDANAGLRNNRVNALSIDTETPTTVFAGTDSKGAFDLFVLKLDPTGSNLLYSTYIGGSLDDFGWGIAADFDGNVYVAGSTASGDFPVTDGAFQTVLAGGVDLLGRGGGVEAIVMKLNPTGTDLVYSSYLGGSGVDQAYGIALDLERNAFVTGLTTSLDFPVSEHAYDTTFGGEQMGGGDAFVTKLNNTGTALVFSTYLGASGDDSGSAISVDSDGNVYVVGTTNFQGFPTTEGAFRRTHGGDPLSHSHSPDAFFTKFDSSSNLLYSTYLGKGVDNFGRAVTVDVHGNAYVTGESLFFATYDVFLSRLQADGAFVDCGPFRFDADQVVGGIAVNGTGQVYVTGRNGPPFPALMDAFVAKIDGCTVAPSDITLIGGSDFDSGQAVTLDQSGNIYVAGVTWSADFPATPGALQPTHAGGASDAFIVKLTDPRPLAIAASTLPEGEVGVTYNADLEVSEGVPPYAVEVIRGSLPEGLSLGSPKINGTPTKDGIKDFTIKVTDQEGASVVKKFKIKIFKTLRVTTQSLKNGKQGKKYSAALKAKGGKKPYTWSMSGELPGGLDFDETTGKITGTPTQAGTFNVTFQVTDSLGGTDEESFTLTINEP